MMKKGMLTIMRMLRWLLSGAAMLVVLALLVLYIPIFQDIIIRKAVNTLNNGDNGIHIE